MSNMSVISRIVLSQITRRQCLNLQPFSSLSLRLAPCLVSNSRGIRGQNTNVPPKHDVPLKGNVSIGIGAPAPRAVFEPVEGPPFRIDRQMGPREERMAKMLHSRDFQNHEIGPILDHFDLETNRDFDIDLMREAADFWILEMKPPKTSLLPKASEKWNNFNWRNATVQSVISGSEPDLLLIDPDAMKYRIQKLLDLGFLNGKSDLFRVFVFAPRAYYLQDWVEFLRKFRYLHHRVLQWLLVGKDDQYPIPHPCVEYGSVMQLSYEQMKSRFEFILRTGVRSPVGSAKSMVQRTKGLTFESLLLTETNVFLRTLAPGVTEEEFHVFEQMIIDNPDDEDDTITEIAELESQGYTDQQIQRKIKRVSKFSTKYGRKNEEIEEEEYKTRHCKLTD